MHNKKLLILKSNTNDFEQFFLDGMNNGMADALPMYNKFAYIFSLFFKIHMHIPFDLLKLKSCWYGRWKKDITKYEAVIVFDSFECISIVNDIHRYNPQCRIILWYWNPIKKAWRVLTPEIRKFAEGWSFDLSDCTRYNLNKNTQFFIPSKHSCDGLKTDFVFIGLDKGRSKLLSQLYQEITCRNLSADFTILTDKTTSPGGSFSYITEPLPYSLVQKKVLESRCVVEVTQECQSGMTLRTLEALFYGKKLLTTNTEIVKEPFYNRSNIYIWGVDSLDALPEFVNSPYIDIPQEIVDQYSYPQWLANFNL